MKVLWIVCNESLASEVREILDVLESVDGYTAWEGLYGANKSDRRSRWGDAIWPGLNWAFWVVGEMEELRPALEQLERLKDTEAARIAGIKAWMQDIERVL